MALHNKGYGPVGRLAKPPVDLLLCFAVKEEMKFFRDPARRRFRCASKRASVLREKTPANSSVITPRDTGGTQVWVTGIGRRNAADNIREAIVQGAARTGHHRRIRRRPQSRPEIRHRHL